MPPVDRPWFRMYSSILTSSKFQTLKDQHAVIWVNLMALSNLQRPRGTLPAAAEIAFQLRKPRKVIESALVCLEAAGLLDRDDAGAYVIHDWSEWQYDPDERSESGSLGNHKRWHAAKGIISDTCTHCQRLTQRVAKNRSAINSESLTVASREEEKRKDETRVETEASDAAVAVKGMPPYEMPVRTPAYKLLQDCFGRPITPMESENLRALEDDYPDEEYPGLLEYAIKAASEANVRRMTYIKSVCEKQAAGEGDPHERTNGARVQNSGGLTPKDRAELDRLGVSRVVPRIL